MAGHMRGSRQAMSNVREVLMLVATDPVAAGERMAAISSNDLTAVLVQGTSQRMGTALLSCLQSAGLHVPEWLERHRFEVATSRAGIMASLAAVAPALTKSGIPWAVLKGPVTASLFIDPHVREFDDLDILVPGATLLDVIEVFKTVGIDDINRNWEPYVQYGVAEFPLVVHGASIDLHWHVIGLERIRRRFTIDVNGLLSRRRTVSLSGTDCFRLDNEDHLLHTALHAGLSGATNFGLLRDIYEVVRSGDIDWDVLADRAHEGGAAPIVGHVLDRAHRILGAGVPRGFPEELAPSTMLAVRGRFDDVAHPWGDPGTSPYSGILVGSSRTGMVGSLSQALEAARQRFTGALGRQSQWSAYDPEGPLFWHTPSGTIEAYARRSAIG